VDTAVVFHAGTKLNRALDGDEEIVTNGGRVLTVTAMAKDPEDARELAYEAYDKIKYAGKFCRRDIGRRREARVARPQEHADEA
jgi:phosphoribosylamine--glycine ligase